MILAIAKFESRSLWRTHTGWASHFAIALILGYMFLGYIDQFMLHWQNQSAVSDAILSPLFADAAVLSLFIVPLIAARSLTLDSPYAPLTLLLSSPVSCTQIVLGKLIGITLYFFPMLAVLAAMCFALSFGTQLDILRVAANFVGLIGVLFVLAATSLFFSALINHVLGATIVTYGILMLLWVLDLTLTGEGAGVISYVAIMPHFEAPRRGWISSYDLAYFIIVTLATITLSARLLDRRLRSGR